jgi:IclR family KDG regulon transcriptional repressor
MAQTRVLQSFKRGLQVMILLVTSGEPLGISEIARTLAMDKAVVHRLVSTLCEVGFAEQDPQTRRYTVGPGLLALSGAVLQSNTLHMQAQPVMQELRRQSGETVHLAVLMDGQAVYVAQEESPAFVNVSARVGQREPLHCTAAGKALLAFLPDDELGDVLDNLDLTSHTSRTITSLDLLRFHLLQTKARGYALDDEESHEGVRCLAAPVFNYQEFVVASIGVSGPSTRVTIQRLPELAGMVKKSAQGLSCRLGYVAAED